MSWPKTTRAQVLARARQGFGDGLYRTPYDQGTLKGGYRTDCSGFVSRALGIPASEGWGGLNTVDLVSSGALVEISLNSLQPGDVAGNCGPGTAGDAGHVVIFGGWYNTDPNDDRYWIFEQAGGTVGPVYRTITWGYPGENVWRAYRYAGITNPPAATPAGTSEGSMAKRILIRKTGTDPVYVTEGMGRWWVPNPGVLGDITAPLGVNYHIGVQVPAAVHEVDDLDAFGPLLGPGPQ